MIIFTIALELLKIIFVMFLVGLASMWFAWMFDLIGEDAKK